MKLPRAVYRYFRQTHVNPPPKQALVFTCLQSKSFENSVGKREIARNDQFLLFPHCFLHIWRTFSHFHQISKLSSAIFSVWKHLQVSFGKGLKGIVCTRAPTYVVVMTLHCPRTNDPLTHSVLKSTASRGRMIVCLFVCFRLFIVATGCPSELRP